jgi:hypothetical protein
MASAEVAFATYGAARSVKAGFFCLVEPDDKVAAPDSVGGTLNVYDDPFHFVRLGDAVPSIPGIGIGVVITMDHFQSGEPLVVRSYSSRPGAVVESWKAAPNDKGLVWLGYLGDGTSAYHPGVWRFEVLRRDDVIFAYEFTILPAGELPEFKDVCRLATS